MGYHGDSLAKLGVEEPMRRALQRTAGRVGQLLRERAAANTPVAKPPPGAAAEWLAARKRLPGTLRESWKVGEVTVRDPIAGVYAIDVYTMDHIAPYVEWPTLPHIIVPRAGGRLRFWDKFGNTIYAMIVHHTGTKGSYMLTTAFREVSELWQAIGLEELRMWAREQATAVRA